jgi:hypothetical protein
MASLDGSESDSTGFAALKNALRSFDRWLTFCCIVILLVQLATILLMLSIHPPA